MIKISKTSAAPSVLSSSKAIEEGEKMQKMVDSHSKVRSFDFNSKIYGDKTVKEQLQRDQHWKCAYCESSLAGDFACVEHYRPKATVRQCKSSTRSLGYYWLAYDWSNLLGCCDICNNRKSDLFPLKNPESRNIINQDISEEEPLLINPTVEDPREFIEFHQHMIVPKIVGDVVCDKGKETIEILGLNDRADLVEARKRRWNEYRKLCRWIKTEHVQEVFAANENPYAGMFQWNKYK